LQAFVPSYLEMSMESFAKNQQEMREKFADALGGKLGYKDFEQITRQNIAMFERAYEDVLAVRQSHESHECLGRRRKCPTPSPPLPLRSAVRRNLPAGKPKRILGAARKTKFAS
jgi:hypothetical protein